MEEKHPHEIEHERLSNLLLNPDNRTPENMARLVCIRGIIDLTSKIQQANPALCYMTACDLIEEMLLS